jgi:hypothetical protein
MRDNLSRTTPDMSWDKNRNLVPGHDIDGLSQRSRRLALTSIESIASERDKVSRIDQDSSGTTNPLSLERGLSQPLSSQRLFAPLLPVPDNQAEHEQQASEREGETEAAS